MSILEPMIVTLYQSRADGALRLYTIHDRQPLLTAKYALTVSWRTGEGREREKIYGFETLADRDKKIRQIFGRKIREGYSLLYSFIRGRSESKAVEEIIAVEA